ncbi:hypothetical protein HYH03_002928 [Edaphochlamys debaryana]|uniref:C2 domain-containing protein n=1 Tax=Edaphochlamys debaryana TaxID=47281 RepID=A0A835YAZ5_9CHLO|nr:hypothetical protein HYH03_002928 [Edaphochlamys debaryana]|eukprot:KAG2499353.1 hypothetical protein HYH03_002928 [Edaphochlamys debaryana]
MGNCFACADPHNKQSAGEYTWKDVAAAKASEGDEAASILQGTSHSRLSIAVSCSGLRRADLLTKSDPFAVLFELRDDGSRKEVCRTELITNCSDPAFVRRFELVYRFEKIQRYRLVVVDCDGGQDPESVPHTECNFLGQLDFALAEVVAAAGKKLTRPLTTPRGEAVSSLVVLAASEVKHCREVYRLRLQASGLRNVELVGKADPFLLVSRKQEDGSWLPVLKTNAVMNDLNPVWGEVVVKAVQLNDGDMLCPLRLQVFDYQSSGSHRPMGEVQLSTARLKEMGAAQGAVVSLEPPPGKPPGDYGLLQVSSMVVELRPTFLDYLAAGAEVGFLVAVDFTGSNGDPRQPGTKHYIGGGPTQYELAVMGIGRVLEFYDHDKVFPAYGFGGRKPGVSAASHCFPLGGSPDGACLGVDGLLTAYRQALREWGLSRPTYFSYVIRQAAYVARESVAAGGLVKYTCLLILTDGEVNDFAETVDAIIEASALPLSILIVCIGDEDFGKMKALDADRRRLSNGQRSAVRDIVQFVEFNRFAGDGTRLAQELLAELPGQMVEWCAAHRIPAARTTPATAPTSPAYQAQAQAQAAHAPAPHPPAAKPPPPYPAPGQDSAGPSHVPSWPSSPPFLAPPTPEMAAAQGAPWSPDHVAGVHVGPGGPGPSQGYHPQPGSFQDGTSLSGQALILPERTSPDYPPGLQPDSGPPPGYPDTHEAPPPGYPGRQEEPPPGYPSTQEEPPPGYPLAAQHWGHQQA